MPQSRGRHKSHQGHNHHGHQTIPAAKHTSKRGAAFVLAISVAVMGGLVALLVNGTAIGWIGLGIIGGAAAGYLIGHNIDKVASNK